MADRFRLALVGAGMITRQSHLPAALASPRAEVSAIVDPFVERAMALAKEYGISPRIAPRVEDVLSEVDGAIIATPNDSHSTIAVRCLNAGVATLIEKPLASTCEEGRAIVLAGEKARTIVAVGYSTRFRDSTVLLEHLLRQGHFGTVRRFVHQFGTPGGWSPLSAYNLERRTSGGGVLVVTGTHFLDRMLHFWGYPDTVELEDDSTGGPEANCTAQFFYTSLPVPFEGVARYSKTFRLPSGMVIETDKGYVTVGDDDNAEIVWRAHATPHVEEVIRRLARSPRFEPADVFQRQLENFIAACRGEEALVVDGKHGIESLRLIEDLYAARRTSNFDWYGRAAEQLQP